MSRQSDYISLVRQSATEFLIAHDKLLNAQREWNALDYSSTLTDFSGANEGLTKEQIGSVVFDTANAFDDVLTAGHATNLHRIRE